MNRRGIRGASIGAGCALAMASAVNHALATVQYNVLDLGTLGGTSSQAYDINNFGRVVGYSKDAGDISRAFVTAPNSAINAGTDLIPLPTGGTTSFGYGINASGVVVGVSSTSSGDRGFRYSGTTVSTLGTVAPLGNWSYAYSINGSGQIAGASAAKNGAASNTHATLYSGNKVYDLGELAFNSDTWGESINSGGAVAGYANVDAGTFFYDHPFLWTPTTNNGTSGTMVDIGTLGGNYGYAWSVNDSRHVVGGSNLPGDTDYHAFEYFNGTRNDLGTLGGTYSEAFDVNLGGVIVGASDVTPGTTHAFVYLNGAMVDLNALIPSDSGWTLQYARAVNDSGQIVGYGVSPSGQVHGFVLTPTFSDSYWNVPTGGLWSQSLNWLNGVPNGPTSNANFTSAITTSQLIDVDLPVTLAGLNFNNAVTYTLAGTNTITMSSAVGNATVTVVNGSHVIAAPVELASPTNVNVNPAASVLTMAGNITSATSSGLIKGGAGTLILSGNNSYGGPTRISGGTVAVSSSSNLGSPNNAVILSGGSLKTNAAITSTRLIQPLASGGSVNTNSFDSSFGAISGPADFSKQGAGKLSTPGITVNNLTVSAGTLAVTPRSAHGGTNSVTRITGALSVAPGAALDLNDNDLVINYSGSSPFTTIQQMVFSGYSDTVDPTRSGIISSTSQGQGGAAILALLDNTLAGLTDWPTGSGQTVSINAIIGKYTYLGDTNWDGQDTPDDYGAIDANLGQTVAPGIAWLSGDTNFDGSVTPDDYGALDANLGLGVGNSLSPAGFTAVPEPATALLSMIGGAALLRRARRQNRCASAG